MDDTYHAGFYPNLRDFELWKDAACRTDNGQLVDLFYSYNSTEILSAKSICEQCPIKVECYKRAVENKEPAGIWGGIRFESGIPARNDAEYNHVIHSKYYVPIASRDFRNDLREYRLMRKNIPDNIRRRKKDAARKLLQKQADAAQTQTERG